MPTRRDFLRHSALLGGALGAGLALPHGVLGAAASGPRRNAPPSGGFGGGSDPFHPQGGTLRPEPRRRLRILLLGGTGFIGPHLVHRIVTRGHELTLFNRGRSQPGLHAELFTGLENLVGDRGGDLSALEGRSWDVVIDNSGYTPDEVGATAELLKNSVRQYLFTSTRGVYAHFRDPVDEGSPVGIEGVPDTAWTGYGPLKALAEREIHARFPRGTGIVRPPIITGPLDNTDRFTFWYRRVDDGGEVMAPGDGTDPIQYIDVRDLADFVVRMAEEEITGVYNVGGPASILTSAGFLWGLRAATGSPVSFTWVDDWDFLEARGLRSNAELPAWRRATGNWVHNSRVDNRRAIAAGLTFRPLAVTAMDTLAWWREKAAAEGSQAMRAGYSREREAEILREWKAR